MTANEPHSPERATQLRKLAMQLMCVAIVVLYLFTTSGWHDGETNVHAFTPIGILLAAIGALGRLWCSSYIAGNKSTRLVMEGPYSLVRNPLYFFSFIGGLGISITTETLTIPLLFSTVFLWYHHGSMTAEEAHLRKVHRDAFHAYAQRVPRFWPRLSGYVEPGRWELSPAAFRRSRDRRLARGQRRGCAPRTALTTGA